jgi:three-Cys-motif partner protein
VVDRTFFDESSDQSQAKAAIVAKYFRAWAQVIVPSAKKGSRRIAYIDLFAGPGRYKDGTKSTPLMVLEQAIANPDLRSMLVTIFNDSDTQSVSSLQTAIDGLPGIETLKYRPKVENEVVDHTLAEAFQRDKLVPTLLFVDPWGYKGLSLNLIGSVLKDWGCDCIFFFNYLRINMGLTNPAFEDHMNSLFGKARADALRTQVEGLAPDERELVIVEELSQALKEKGGSFVLPFRFRNANGQRTTHHLIFVSKHFRGYEIMKDIMSKESSSSSQGVPSFEYNPADERQPLLFELARPLDELSDMLLREFARRCVTVLQIYEEHSVGRRFTKKNYKQAVRQLEAESAVTTDPPAASRRVVNGEVTVADHVVVRFP